ncbi:hypothetical protein [uncultured Rikenella sp.]|nr:hypothetical protein [uncultured Rikenella sp.]
MISNGGYSWASTVCGAHGMHLDFNVVYLNPQMQDARAYGFQLRCLSE